MNAQTKSSAIAAARAFVSGSHMLLIGGGWECPLSGRIDDVFDPSTGEIVARVPSGGPDDMSRAVAAARSAFDEGPWTRMPAKERGRLLLRLAGALQAAADEVAAIESIDNGRPLRLSRIEHVGNAIDVLEYYAGWATKLSGSTLDIAAPGEYHTYTLREPVGVAGLITAWNVPLQMAAMKLGAALAAGCTTILKPAEQTPLSALRLGQLALDVGFPPGVINIVTGLGPVAGAALVAAREVDKISFTGSVATGKAILHAATGNLKRVTLELGGKSPVIIFPDADLDVAIPAAASAAFHNSGQVCAAGTRLFAHRSVFDVVVDGIARRAEALRVGLPFDEDSELGPLISQSQKDRVLGYIKTGASENATVLAGGTAIDRPGYFVKPTVLTKVTPDMAVVREEIFGPVLAAMAYGQEDLDAIAKMANETIYGLSARIFTRDLSTAHRLARRIRAGSIRINGGVPDVNVPFGGYKQSGWGREGAREGIESYTEVKTVIAKLA